MKTFTAISVSSLAALITVQGFSASNTKTSSNVPYFLSDVASQEPTITNPVSTLNDSIQFTVINSQTPHSVKKENKLKTKKPAFIPDGKGRNPAHKAGVFSPIVYYAKDLLGENRLNSIRGDAITLHSNIIKRFVATYSTPFGKRAIQDMFTVADTDGNGKLDKEEMKIALKRLGFTWLKDKQTDGIFKRADIDQDGFVSFEEFSAEVPNTLRTNLVKLAKKNGGDMGLLV